MAAVTHCTPKPILQPPQTTPSPFADFPLAELENPALSDLYYVLCNELNQEEVLLNLTTARANGVHLGFACWMNFDILAEQNTPYALLCDANDNMIALLNVIKSCVLASDAPGEFMEKFWKNLSSNQELDFQSLLGIDRHYDKASFALLMEQKGWLSTPEKFHAIKTMYAEERILHHHLNIVDVNAFAELKAWAQRHDLVFYTIYTSNIANWLHHSRGQVEVMLSNIETLLNPNTSVVSAQKSDPLSQEAPKQELTVGSHPKLKYTTTSKASTRHPGGSVRGNLFG